MRGALSLRVCAGGTQGQGVQLAAIHGSGGAAEVSADGLDQDPGQGFGE